MVNIIISIAVVPSSINNQRDKKAASSEGLQKKAEATIISNEVETTESVSMVDQFPDFLLDPVDFKGRSGR